MAKRRKSAFSPADLRALLKLKRRTDALYKNFWAGAQGTKPPRPPKIEPLLCSIGHVVDFIAKLPPPRPPL